MKERAIEWGLVAVTALTLALFRIHFGVGVFDVINDHIPELIPRVLP